LGKDIRSEIGRVLRRVRQARGLTLRDVGARSHGRLKPTAVAGYERAERSISVRRFWELCELYGVRPVAILAEIVQGAEGRPPVVLDLTRMGELDSLEARIANQFIEEILALRGEQETDTLTLRGEDVELLATAAGDRPEEFLRSIARAIRRP
jgi:transcriptional regulator with XRE-family HTH domain